MLKYNEYLWKTAALALVVLGLAGQVHAADYYVSQAGSDFDEGSIDFPFATIQKAADVMEAGDTCYIRGGVYRETVRTDSGGRFTAYNGEDVVVTGLDRVVNWELYQDGIYRTSIEDDVTQVFVDWERMNLARFPDMETDDMLAPTLGTVDEATGAEYPAISTIQDDAITQPGGYWTGARLFLLGGRKWVAWCVPIEEHSGSTLSFAWPGGTEDAYVPTAGSTYFITDTLNTLDTEREWFYDDEENLLYLMAPGGVDPTTLEVGVRTRMLAFDAAGSSNVEISGLTLFAGGVSFDDAENCVLENSLVVYPVPYFHADAWNRGANNSVRSSGVGIALGGQGNMVRNCEIRQSWGDGVTVYGSGNTVENCLIHDVDWSATDCAPITTCGSDHIIYYNTLYDTGRSGILNRKTGNTRFEYNDISRYGCMTTDLGATYCYETEGNGSIIAYNLVHDPVSDDVGIYLDNHSSEFIVHHNVIWNCANGIQTNKDAVSHQIYHNTVWNCVRTMTTWGPEGTSIINQRVYNNLSDGSLWIGTDLRRNLTVADGGFIDAEHGNFQLGESSPARDDYYAVPDIANGGFESTNKEWYSDGGVLMPVNTQAHSGEKSMKVIWRRKHTDGTKQSIATVFMDCGQGDYTFEAWVMTAAGNEPIMLRIVLVDDTDVDRVIQVTEPSVSGEWVKLTLQENITWSGTVQEAVFEVITTESDTDFENLYIDDCHIIPPGGTGVQGAVIVPGINDAVSDGKPDAGAYEYGGPVWQAGSDMTVAPQPEPVDNFVPTIHLEAELFDDMSGVELRGSVVAGCDAGDWVMFRGIDLGNGYATVRVRYAASESGGGIEIRDGDPASGSLLAELALEATGDSTVFADQTAPLDGASGVKNIYVVFTGGTNIGHLDKVKLEDGTGGGSPPDTPESLWVEEVTQSGLTLNWSDVDNETGYWVERSFGSDTFTTIAVVLRNTTQYVDSGLLSGASYTYRVRAYNIDGKSPILNDITATTGSSMSEGVLLEAEAYDEMEGIIPGETGVGGCDNNDWIKFSGVNLGSGYQTLRIRVGVPDEYAGQNVEVRSGDPFTGELLGTLTVETTGSWGNIVEQTTSLTGASGVLDIYFVFKGGWGVGNFDWFNFEDPGTAVEEPKLPVSYDLGQNYPNPFNPVTHIPYQIPETAHVRLEIYDILGRRVRALVDTRQQPGYYMDTWDSLDESGSCVSSGVYLYRVTMEGMTSSFIKARKLLLIR